MKKNDELNIPENAKNDSNSFELLRVWVANKKQECVVRIGVWNDPAAWGILLSDIARHIANTFELESITDKAQALARIREAFNIELQNPTDDPKGDVIR